MTNNTAKRHLRRIPGKSWEDSGIEDESSAVGYETNHVESHSEAPS
jgi:hypothetical protein